MNYIMSLIGATLLVIVGIIIGFWLEIAITPSLPNGFVECKECGPSWVDNARWWTGKKHDGKKR